MTNAIKAANAEENYLREFLRVLFANQRLIKRVFLVFTAAALLLPLVVSPTYDIMAEVIVQSKKLAQADVGSVLSQELDRFVPPTLADMETEASILRSTGLIRKTLSELRDEGLYVIEPGLLSRFVVRPLKRALVYPTLDFFAIPYRSESDADLDAWTEEVFEDDLEVTAIPGSNVVQVIYSFEDAAMGTRFVERLLQNYLKNRRELQSGGLTPAFYEQKRAQYEKRLAELEGRRQTLLASAAVSDPKEEITFRLNAINAEEQQLNVQRDNAVESRKRIEYLHQSMDAARIAGMTEFSFPFSFAGGAGNMPDNEIKITGDQLNELVTRFGNMSESYQANSVPMQQLHSQIERTRAHFLQLVEDRIKERENELAIIEQVVREKTARIAEYKERVRQLQEIQSNLRYADTEIEALHKAFFTYAQRYEESRGEATIDEDLDKSNSRILTPPREPAEPAFPKMKLVIPLGMITGLLLGVALAYVREFFDHRFRHPLQVAQRLNLPVLMVVNEIDKGEAINPYRRWSLKWFWQWVKQ